MSYEIKLENGKYLIVNDNGSLTILRNGEPWPAAEELKHVKLVLCLAQRIEELETKDSEDAARFRFFCAMADNQDGPEIAAMTRAAEAFDDAPDNSTTMIRCVDAARAALAAQ